MEYRDRIIFIDTETGGLHPAYHSLLSVGLVEWESGNILQTKEILVDDGELKATDEALAINKIDLSRHRESAISQKETVQEILSFIDKALVEKVPDIQLRTWRVPFAMVPSEKEPRLKEIADYSDGILALMGD